MIIFLPISFFLWHLILLHPVTRTSTPTSVASRPKTSSYESEYFLGKKDRCRNVEGSKLNSVLCRRLAPNAVSSWRLWNIARQINSICFAVLLLFSTWILLPFSCRFVLWGMQMKSKYWGSTPKAPKGVVTQGVTMLLSFTVTMRAIMTRVQAQIHDF